MVCFCIYIVCRSQNNSSFDGSYLSIILYVYLPFVKLVMYTNLHMDHNNICGVWVINEKWNQNLVVRKFTQRCYICILLVFMSVCKNIFEDPWNCFHLCNSSDCIFFSLMNTFFFSHDFLRMNIPMHFRVCSQLKSFFPWSYGSLPKKYFIEYKLIF